MKHLCLFFNHTCETVKNHIKHIQNCKDENIEPHVSDTLSKEICLLKYQLLFNCKNLLLIKECLACRLLTFLKEITMSLIHLFINTVKTVFSQFKTLRGMFVNMKHVFSLFLETKFTAATPSLIHLRLKSFQRLCSLNPPKIATTFIPRHIISIVSENKIITNFTLTAGKVNVPYKYRTTNRFIPSWLKSKHVINIHANHMLRNGCQTIFNLVKITTRYDLQRQSLNNSPGRQSFKSSYLRNMNKKIVIHTQINFTNFGVTVISTIRSSVLLYIETGNILKKTKIRINKTTKSCIVKYMYILCTVNIVYMIMKTCVEYFIYVYYE